jgi:DNA-binding NtrC family response regulator
MAEPARRNRWPILFQQAEQPIFLLSSAKRIRFVNSAWEALTGVASSEAVGHACLRRGPTADLYRTLAPPPEATKGHVATVRRSVPPKELGPPWWDVTFVPMRAKDGLGGYLGLITVVAADPPGTKAVVPASVAALRDEHARSFNFELLGGTGPAVEKFVNQVRHAAASTAPVWIVGECGSGKETVARVIHHNGPHRDRGFFGVDCAGMPDFLLEGILFGRGSFGESGRLGTLYLKEPSALPRDAQQHMLKWLAGPGANVRLICGSMETSSLGVAAGRLVPEFLSHFSVLELRVSPLRERTVDLPQIVERILPRLTGAAGKSRTLASYAYDVLRNYPWPGNLRELVDVLSDAEGDGPIHAESLPRFLREKAALADLPPVKAEPGPKLDEVLAEVEKRLIGVALNKSNGNATKAAEWLGIARTRLLRRAEAFGLKSAEEKEKPPAK